MARLLKRLNPEISVYRDRRFEGDEVDWERALRTSTTLYIGNLSFYTREEQIYEVFSKCGHVERIVMGLDKQNKTPCGFCFVIYYTRREAEAAVRYLNGTVLDDRAIRVDHDWGYVDGRQWGRGRSGGQVRDEFRMDYDPGRGGFGKVVQKELEAHKRQLLAGFNEELGGGGFTSPRDQQQGAPDAKRRRMGTDGDAGREREDNPRYRQRERGRGGDSDEEH